MAPYVLGDDLGHDLGGQKPYWIATLYDINQHTFNSTTDNRVRSLIVELTARLIFTDEKVTLFDYLFMWSACRVNDISPQTETDGPTDDRRNCKNRKIPRSTLSIN